MSRKGRERQRAKRRFFKNRSFSDKQFSCFLDIFRDEILSSSVKVQPFIVSRETLEDCLLYSEAQAEEVEKQEEEP